MATEIGPIVAAADWRSLSDPDLISWQPTSVEPTLEGLNLHLPSCVTYTYIHISINIRSDSQRSNGLYLLKNELRSVKVLIIVCECDDVRFKSEYLYHSKVFSKFPKSRNIHYILNEIRDGIC